MARLRKRAGCDDYYVVSAFRREGRLLNVTYQLTPSGIDRLLDVGLKDGDHIPESVFAGVLADGDAFTGKSGVEGVVDFTPPLKPAGVAPSPVQLPAAALGHEEMLRAIPSSMVKPSEIRSFIRARFPGIIGKPLQELVEARMAPKLQDGPRSDGLLELLRGRKLTAIHDHGSCIVLVCEGSTSAEKAGGRRAGGPRGPAGARGNSSTTVTRIASLARGCPSP